MRNLLFFAGLLFSTSAFSADRVWQRTFERISGSILAIQVDQTRPFDGQFNQSTEATGFVVDAARGLVLTNRHVVNPGPVIARGLFTNGEEIALEPVYRDPVHDFGFFRYDPEALRFAKPESMKLHPEAARPGISIWVVGNDDGEELAVLQGTLARKDRAAPNYGWGRYNDFNTFYYQAASGMSGGSSGSPAVNRRGQVVALAAGANRASAASFFLPLERVARALRLLQQNAPVPRGTLQTTFSHRTFAELRRGGLSATTEASARDADGQQKGLLAASHILPGSPAAEVLRTGDVIIALQGRAITDFLSLSDVLDTHVGQTVDLEIERAGKRVLAQLPVTDLHTITPDEYIELDGTVVHQLSYQQARHYHRPMNALYVAEPGFTMRNANLGTGDLLTELNGQPLTSLDDLEAVLTSTAPGAWMGARLHKRAQPKAERYTNLQADRTWYPTRRCSRLASGMWGCRDIAAATTAADPGAAAPAAVTSAKGSSLKDMFVHVRFEQPYWVAGQSATEHSGTGVVVDAARGWVLVDRTTVPVAVGNFSVTFNGSEEVPAQLVYMHPTHNLVIVGYDPARVAHLPVAEADLGGVRLDVGQEVTVAGIDSQHAFSTRSTTVSSVRHTVFPNTSPPKFASATVRASRLASAPDHFEGVLLDKQERVGAFWLSYARQSGSKTTFAKLGIDAELIADTLAQLRAGEAFRSLEVDWQPVTMPEALRTGIPAETLSMLRENNVEQLFAVVRINGAAPSAEHLRIGDMVLSVADAIPTTTHEIERASQQAEVAMKILRRGQVLSVTVPTLPLPGNDMDRLVLWGGAAMHTPERALALQLNQPTHGVYVGSYRFGSPASRFGLEPVHRIVEAEGKVVSNLDDMVAVLRDVQHGDTLTLRVVNIVGNEKQISLIADHAYWPPYELVREDGQWLRRELGQ